MIFVEERLYAAVPVDRYELLLRPRADVDDEVGQRGGILHADSPASAQARSGMRTLVSGVSAPTGSASMLHCRLVHSSCTAEPSSLRARACVGVLQTQLALVLALFLQVLFQIHSVAEDGLKLDRS